MSVFEERRIADEYAHGRSEGYAQGEVDMADGLGVATLRINDMTERMQTTTSRRLRAFMLGYLRGYREVVRTLMNGRWGT